MNQSNDQIGGEAGLTTRILQDTIGRLAGEVARLKETLAAERARNAELQRLLHGEPMYINNRRPERSPRSVQISGGFDGDLDDDMRAALRRLYGIDNGSRLEEAADWDTTPLAGVSGWMTGADAEGPDSIPLRYATDDGEDDEADQQQPTPQRPGFYTEHWPPEDGSLTISGAEDATTRHDAQ